MLPGLRHGAIVSCNYEHAQIDTINTCNHIINESYVTGNIDKGNSFIVVRFTICKTEID